MTLKLGYDQNTNQTYAFIYSSKLSGSIENGMHPNEYLKAEEQKGRKFYEVIQEFIVQNNYT